MERECGVSAAPADTEGMAAASPTAGTSSTWRADLVVRERLLLEAREKERLRWEAAIGAAGAFATAAAESPPQGGAAAPAGEGEDAAPLLAALVAGRLEPRKLLKLSLPPGLKVFVSSTPGAAPALPGSVGAARV